MGCPIPTYYQIALGGMTVFNFLKNIKGEDNMDNKRLERRQQLNGLGITGFLGLTLDWMGIGRDLVD